MWLGKQRGRAEVSDTYSVNLHGEVIHVWRIRVNLKTERFWFCVSNILSQLFGHMRILSYTYGTTGYNWLRVAYAASVMPIKW